MNLSDLKKIYSGDNFDLITVNPPYFKNIELSMKNIDEHKKIARHEVETNLEEIIKISVYLLKNDGYFAMVHRTERFLEVIEVLKKYNLIPKKVQFIYPKIHLESNLFMVECTKNGKDGVKILEPLIIHNEDGSYINEIFRKEVKK